MIGYREFIYSGNPVPPVTEREYPAFYLQFQKSILASLEKRGLLTSSQYERCIGELEGQYRERSHFHVGR